MKNSMAAGSIAGCVSGIVAVVCSTISNITGLIPSPVGAFGPYENILQFAALVIFLLNIIWGAILGVLYEKTYNIIPRKGILKGFTYSIVIFLISNIRPVSFSMAFASFNFIFQYTVIGFFVLASYGIVLGYLYKKE